MVEPAEAPKEIPLGELPIGDLEGRLNEVRAVLTAKPDDDEAKRRFNEVAVAMAEQTNGMYSYVEGVREDLEEGLSIDKELDLAHRRAAEIKNPEARRFIKVKIRDLERMTGEAAVVAEAKREKAKRPFRDKKFKELVRLLEEAKENLKKKEEPDYKKAKAELPKLEKEMNERTGGLYGLIQDLREDLEAKRPIDDELREAKWEATKLRKKDREAGKFIKDRITELEKEVAEKREAALRPEVRDKRVPGVEEEVIEVIGRGMKSGKKKEELPAVYLSQYFTTLKDVKLPAKEYRPLETEEGVVSARVYRVETLAQALMAGLTELHSMIKGNEAPFDTIQKATIRYYVSIVEDWAGEDSPVYKDFTTLTEGTFKLFDVMYRSWLIQRGKKHAGVNDILGMASGKLPTRTVWFFRQDPEIESATHRIKGFVTDDSFRDGASGRGDLGDVLGKEYGAVEKIGYFISLLDYQGVFAGYGPVRRACYNALYLRNTLEVLGTKGIYENVERLFEPTYIYYTADGERRVGLGITPEPEEIDKIPVGGKVFRTQYGIVPYPSAHHQPSGTRNVEWILDNFMEKKLGWRNLARMLVCYGTHDPRWGERIGLGERAKEEGYYTLEEWFFAKSLEQTRMCLTALRRFKTLNKEDQKRIIKNNLLTIYDYAEKQEDGKLEWFTKPLLDFDEKDRRGYIVDIGSLDRKNWCGGLEGDYLNEFYTAEEYAWRTYDTWNKLCQTDMKHQMERFRDLLDILTADTGYRHLTESVEKGRPVAMLVERRRQIEHLFTAFSESWLARIWADRREGRRNPDNVPLSWELGVNERLRYGLDSDRYRKEFESAGIFGIDYTNTYENLARYGYQEKVAKILAKFELKDAWIEYLKDVVGLDKEILRVLDVPLAKDGSLTEASHRRLIEISIDNGLHVDLQRQAGNRRRWHFYPKEIGKVAEVDFRHASNEQKARIILDELTYRAIVHFAGFEIKKEFLEYDQYGLPAWRTWFDFDFDLETGRGRGDGKERKGIYNDNQWEQIKSYLIYHLDDDLYSPFKYMNEKLEEDTVEAGIGEAYYRQTFDKDIENYITPYRWRGMARKDKKRWDMFAHMYRNRRYTVGELKGQYVTSQLKIELNPKTLLPCFENSETGAIIEVEERTKKGWKIKHPATDQLVEVKRDEITGLPIITEPENFRVRLLHTRVHLHPEELPTPEIAWFYDPKTYDPKRLFPGLYGHDRLGTMAWGTEGVWSTRKENRGMGMAGLEKQLTWEPFFYNKNIRKAFFLARYGDPRYVIELGLNTAKEWEVHQVYHLTVDEEQRFEFFGQLQNIGEDVGWVMAEAIREGVDAGQVEDYKDVKKSKRIPDITGKVKEGVSEEALIGLSGLMKEVIPLPKGLTQRIPVLRSSTERNCVLKVLAIGEVPFLALSLTGVTMAVDPVTALLLLGASQIPPFFLLRQVLDKGVDEQGREKARGFARAFGHAFGLGVGMVGDRMNARNPLNLACGYEPVHDSVLPMKELVEYWFKLPKEKLVRMRVSY